MPIVVYDKIVLKDGGALVIETQTINKWKKIFPNVNYKEFENKLLDPSNIEVFAKSSKRKALQLIKNMLKEENAQNASKTEIN